MASVISCFEPRNKLRLMTISQDQTRLAVPISTSIRTLRTWKGSKPRTHVIAESFRSIRHILEHAAGAAMAHSLIAEVIHLLSRH
jgi:hypothetical protein